MVDIDNLTEAFLAIGSEELEEDIPDFIKCENCSTKHRVKTITAEGVSLHYYECKQRSYFAGINGKVWRKK